MADTFLGFPKADLANLAGVRAAVLGVSEASPYKPGEPSHSAMAPAMIREAGNAWRYSLGQHDFDLGATLVPGGSDYRGLADCGDLVTGTTDAAANRDVIEVAVRTLLSAGVTPIILGGDDSVPIPVLKAYEDHGPLTILQIDAHVDWADVIQDNPYGYGSPMRRAAEFAWVANMVQVGIRGLGSGESWQHDDARSWGSKLVTSYALHRDGPAAVLDHIPEGANCFISIDCDGIDPAVFPAVAMPTPGGLTYEDVIVLLRGVAAKGRIAGLALTEYVPERDDRYQLSGQIAARIVGVTMGLAIAKPSSGG